MRRPLRRGRRRAARPGRSRRRCRGRRRRRCRPRTAPGDRIGAASRRSVTVTLAGRERARYVAPRRLVAPAAGWAAMAPTRTVMTGVPLTTVDSTTVDPPKTLCVATSSAPLPVTSTASVIRPEPRRTARRAAISLPSMVDGEQDGAGALFGRHLAEDLRLGAGPVVGDGFALGDVRLGDAVRAQRLRDGVVRPCRPEHDRGRLTERAGERQQLGAGLRDAVPSSASTRTRILAIRSGPSCWRAWRATRTVRVRRAFARRGTRRAWCRRPLRR